MDELKRKLEAGEITQEEYEAAVKQMGEGGTGEPDPEEERRKAIQAAEDRVRTEYVKKQKALEAELEKLRREKMTEEERQQLEKEEYEKRLREREEALTAREVELHTINTLTAESLPLGFRDFVKGDSVETTTERIQDFKKLWNAELEKAVKAAFKDAGRNPEKGGSKGGSIVNPWKKETENLTQQAQIYRENPELARQLMAQAGVR